MGVYVPGVVPSLAIRVPWLLNAVVAMIASYKTEMQGAGNKKPRRSGVFDLCLVAGF